MLSVQSSAADLDPARTLSPGLRAAGQEPVGPWLPMRGGRSNLLWQVPTVAGDVVVKLYCSASASAVFPNDSKAESRVLQALQGTGIAPDLLTEWVSPFGPCLAYRHLPGPVWQGDVEAVARLLARVHAHAAPAGMRDLGNLRGQIVRQCAALKDGGVLWLTLLSRLPRGNLPAVAPRLLHGDPVPGNIIETAEGLRLIDWQCPAAGDPALDLAIFLSPAMWLLNMGRVPDEAEKARFLAAYAANGDPSVVARLREGAPFFHALMAAYCALRAQDGSAVDARGLELELAALESCAAREG